MKGRSIKIGIILNFRKIISNKNKETNLEKDKFVNPSLFVGFRASQIHAMPG